MIPKEEAIEIAKHAAQIELGYFPTDAVLKHAYSSRQKWIFEWKHKRELFASEIDRILVWVSAETGEVLKLEIKWKPFETSSTTLATDDIRTIIAERVEQIEGIDVVITEYREIKKEAYAFFIPVEEIKDCYWIGESDNRIFLVEEEGRIIGELVMPESKGVTTSGHGYTRDCVDFVGCECWCWSYIKNLINSYFEKWSSIETGCTPVDSCTNGYITLDEYENRVKNGKTKFYGCVCHGSNAWFHFVPYTEDSCYTASEEQRINWGCVNSVEKMFESRSSVRLALLVHCGAMDGLGPDNIEYYFRKGETENTVVIGLKDTTDESWIAFYDWLPTFLQDIDGNRNKSIKEAYDDAVDTYPDINGHIDLTGDVVQTLDRILQSDVCVIG